MNQQIDWARLEAQQRKTKMPNGDVVYNNDEYSQELYEMMLRHLTGRAVSSIDSEQMVDVPKVGQRLTGTLTGQLGNEIFLDYGGKYSVVMKIDSNEIAYLINDDGTSKSVGDRVDFLVTGNNRQGDITGSLYGLQVKRHADYLHDIIGTNEFISAKVVSVNKFGYNMDYNGVPLFMLHFNADVNKIPNEQQDEMVGREFLVGVEGFSEQNGNYQVSRKRYMETLIPAMIEKLVSGEVYEGVVTGTTKYGVFVQFQDVLTGMIHKNNVSEQYREDLSQIPAGTLISFYYRETLKGNKIILTQYWKESVWDTIEKGDIYEGTVESVRHFGVLVRLDWDTMGVLHNHNLPKGKELQKGDVLDVCVESFARNERKIFLSLAD